MLLIGQQVNKDPGLRPPEKEMDEWDEFLSRAQDQDQEMHSAESETETETVDKGVLTSQPAASDLGEYEDNAEVLIQMARGESFNDLSSNGLWIKSDISGALKGNTGFMGKKRTLKTNSSVPSVPVANSVQDLTRAITGHPSLSHPLSLLLKQDNRDVLQLEKACEIDSLGLFFYGAPGEVKVDFAGKDDMMKIIEMKKKLIDQSINVSQSVMNMDVNKCFDNLPCDVKISHENLKLLSGSIPPNGKTGWLIPFTVNSNTVDLNAKAAYKLDPLGLFFEYCEKSVLSQLGNGLVEPIEHFITFEDSMRVLVQTCSPPFNISVNFRGESHVDPTSILTNFLFYRQSNYSIEVDFENLKIKSIKSFLPKFDTQNRLFLLLKALRNKLTKLADGNYFLSHQANTPFIKILSFQGDSDEITV